MSAQKQRAETPDDAADLVEVVADDLENSNVPRGRHAAALFVPPFLSDLGHLGTFGCEAMKTIFSTAGLTTRQAIESYMDIGCKKVIPLDEVELIDPDHFFFDIKGGALADLAILSWRSSPVAWRMWRYRSEHLLLTTVRGACSAERAVGDDSFTMNEHNLVLSEPTASEVSGYATMPVEMIGLRIPRRALERRIPLGKVTNRPIPIQGDAALLAAILRLRTQIGPSSMSPEAAALLRSHALDWISLVFGKVAGVRPELASPAQMQMLKLRIAIEAQLTNPRADRESIVAAAGLSKRSASRILANEGTSIRELLTERRLTKCREALEDPQRDIAEIAMTYGFTNLTAFIRIYRSHYGVSPADYRAWLFRAKNGPQ